MARAIVLLLIAFAIFPITALAKEYIVGDADGWNSEVDYYAWLDGKTFYVGDVLGDYYYLADNCLFFATFIMLLFKFS